MSEVADATGGDALVELLGRNGVSAAFGIVSVHNLPLVDALDRRLRWVPTRTEAGAVNAADGYARTTDGLGCAVTSTGTGAGNAAGALVEALTAGSPVLHLTGQIDRTHLGRGRGVIHETGDQLAMLASVSKAASTLGRSAGAALVGGASEALRHPRGPVSLEWPIDEQYLDHQLPPPVPEAAADASVPIDPPALDRAAMADAADLMAGASRPLLWLGGGARWFGAEVDRLASVIGAGVLTSNAGRGTLPESIDQRVVGNFATNPACAELLADADLLISVGTHFRSNETKTYRLALPRPHIQIDVDPAAIGRSYQADVGLVGLAGPILDRLADTAGPGPSADWLDRVAATRAAVRAKLAADIGPYAEICAALNRALPAGTNLVRDITIPNSSWGNRLLDVDDPTTNLNPRGGGIGQALAMGIGAAVARPERHTMVLIGDGGLQVQLGELATVRQEHLDITLIVFDDGGYGVLRNMQDAHLGRRSGVDLFTPDYEAVAAANDLAYVRAETTDRFETALAAMVAAEGPGMIHVDCAKIGPMPVPFTPPVDIPRR